MKFKVGDEVILIKANRLDQIKYLNKNCKIYQINDISIQERYIEMLKEHEIDVSISQNICIGFNGDHINLTLVSSDQLKKANEWNEEAL